MNVTFHELTIKNFMSVGNNTQTVNLNNGLLTVIIGNNQDLKNAGARNGVGKTTILNALCYALYGRGMSNIKKDNLINKFNSSQMLVTLDFEANGIRYRIERGRKPAVISWYVNSGKVEVPQTDDSEGESKWTNREIEKIIGMSFELFVHILGMSGETIPFLALGSTPQRNIIEELFGITTLTVKADLLREQIKLTKDAFKEEEIRIASRKESNANIQKTIDNVKLKSRQFILNNETKIETLTKRLNDLAHVVIEDELAAHEWVKQNEEVTNLIRQVSKEIERNTRTLERLTSEVESLLVEADTLSSATCPTCSQNLPDHSHADLTASVNAKIAQREGELTALLAEQEELKLSLEKLNEEKLGFGEAKVPFYDTINEAYDHKNQIDTLMTQLEAAMEATNPYDEQVAALEQTGLQEIDYTLINELNTFREHQEFLLKLLTDKGSFIRKKIIDQNLPILNNRLSYFLEKIDLPHRIVFRNDLSVDIMLSGIEYDYENLSRGERTRVVLAVCLAFRDVYETIHHRLNLMFIDEMTDFGIDPYGALMIYNTITEMSDKTIYLVTHREEIISRSDNTLIVTKHNGYATFDYMDEISE